MNRFKDRVQRLERRLTNNGADGAIIGVGPNSRYFTGFAGERDRHLLLLITSSGRRVFVSPEAYVEQVRNAARIGDVQSVSDNTATAVVDGLVASLTTTDGHYYVDNELPAGEAYRLQRELPGATIDLLDAIVSSMRETKDEMERDALRQAAALTDEVSVVIREKGADVIGMTEKELAVEIRTLLHERGAEGVAFPVVVAAGPNGARPTQYRHGNRTIEKDEPVVLDFGGSFNGYASDQTRTMLFEGKPSDAFIETHGVVREALETGLDSVETGMTGGELDAIVRDVIADYGYADQFITGTGHGVGLRAHEPPSITPESDDELGPGMVFSIEPGIYVEGEFGVRLETLVLLTEDGPEMLNESPYTWDL